MPATRRNDNESGRAGGPSRRRMLVALATGAMGASVPVAGQVRTGETGANDRSGGVRRRSGDSAVAGRSTTSGSWRLFQSEPKNTGHDPAGGGPRSAPGARWGFRDGDSFEAAPVVSQDTVYGADGGGETVVAVDRSDGTERWRTDVDVDDGRMTLSDGTLFVPGNDLLALSARDGSVQWSVGIGNPKAVAVRGEYAYVAASAGVYRVDLGTREVDWHVDRVKQLQRGLAVTSEYVYGAGSQYGSVIALDPATGGRRWLRRLDGTTVGAPTARGKRVVVPTDEGLVGLSYESGVPRWRHDASVRSSVAIADDTVIATGTDEGVYALDPTSGDEKWQTDVAPGSNPPVVVGGLLYVAGTDGTLAAIVPSDGSIVWRTAVGGARDAGVAVAGGELYVGDRDGQLAALAGSASGGLSTPTPSPTPAEAGGEDATPGGPTATPTSTGAPGFGPLAGAVATGAAALAALRERADGED